MEEKDTKRIGYTPSPDAERFIADYCEGDDALLSKNQLVEIAVIFLASQPEDVLDKAILKGVKRKKESHKKGEKRKTA